MRYLKRLTHSARGELFNVLIWPSLICTFVYSLGFAVLIPLGVPVGSSSLYDAMNEVGPNLAVIWGWAGLLTIFGGMFFLMFNRPPLGKFSGLLGFMVWTFAALIYVLTGNWLVLAAIAFPNMLFWFWQYLSLSVFNKQDKADKKKRENKRP